MSFERLIVPHENKHAQIVDDLLNQKRLDGKWVKVLDRQRATDIARAFPAVNVIFRDTRGPGENLSDWRREYPDPLACVDAIMIASEISPLPNLVVESNINEPKLLSEDDAIWLGTVEAIRSQRLKARGLRAAIGSFGTSHPSTALFVVFMRTYVDLGGDLGALIATHEYGRKEWTPADRSNLLHVIDLRAAISGLACHRMLFAITESGFDDVGPGSGGYLDPAVGSNEQDLIRVMGEYERELIALGFVVCVCVFAYEGGERWKYYEMTQAKDFNFQIAAVEAPPTLTGANPPDDWTHSVDASLGLRVRSSPTTTTATGAYTTANVIANMTNGCKVRVISTAGDWAAIDFPIVGFTYLPNLDVRVIESPLERRLAEALKMTWKQRLIDISANQVAGDVPFETLADAGYLAVMIRVTIALAEDAVWLSHWRASASIMRRFLYSVFSFTAGWERQVDVLLKALDRVPLCPTVAIDLELPNASKNPDPLVKAIEKLRANGVPLAWYGRGLWVKDNLTDASILKGLPFIVAHYKNPVDETPIVPDGFTAHAWQYVAGEKVIPDRMWWGLAMTRSLKHLDESKVLEPGLEIYAA